MPNERFRIRIKSDGKILFLAPNMTEERQRLLREVIEDCLGPTTRIAIGDSDGDTGGTKLADRKKEELRRS